MPGASVRRVSSISWARQQGWGSLFHTDLGYIVWRCFQVRALARAKDDTKRDLLAACDRLRDLTLVDLGIRLEDKADGRWGEGARGEMGGQGEGQGLGTHLAFPALPHWWSCGHT